jgi:hypothetical protein
MDGFIDNYMSKNGSKSKSTETTMRGNMKRLEKVLGVDVEDMTVKDFKNSEKVLDKLIENYSLASVISTVNGVIAFLRFLKAPDGVVEDYVEITKDLAEERKNVSHTQEKSELEKENWIDYSELKPKVEEAVDSVLERKVPPTVFRNIMMVALLTLQPPARLGNYLDMVYKDGSKMKRKAESLKKDRNYVIEDDGKFKFVFNKYKTAKSVGQVVSEVKDERLNKLLSKWFQDYNTSKKDFLVNANGSKMSQEGASNAIRSGTKRITGKELTLNALRHIFLTHFTSSNPSIEEKTEVAALVGQTYKPSRMELYARV